MNFDEFVKKGLIRKSSKDVNLAKALIKETDKDMKFFDSLEVNELSARKLFTNYYDFLRSVLEAITALDGYKVYSHDFFGLYLKGKGEKVLSIKFDRLRKMRNKVNYYGESLSVDESKENISEIKEMINILKSKYL